jgi:hypothetical protein
MVGADEGAVRVTARTKGWAQYANDEGEVHYHYTVSLRLSHPKEDSALWTHELGRQPWHSQQVGQPRTTPDGRVSAAIANESFWTVSLPAPQWMLDLEGALEETIDGLSVHQDTIRRIAKTGGTAELFIGLSLERFNTGFELPTRLLRKLSHLELKVSFDIYCFDAKAEAPTAQNQAAS